MDKKRSPFLSLVWNPRRPEPLPRPSGRFRAATYNVHRWTGLTGGNRYQPELATEVIGELDADILALQEVLRPFHREDPLLELADRLDFHLAFVCSRMHKRGELGNAILSRWPLRGALSLDLNFSRFEQRSAVAAELRGDDGPVAVVATHLALVDATRTKQVEAILDHPQLQGPVMLFGDMNAWRRCKATRQLNEEFLDRHHNRAWPATFPAASPILALDRIYARGVRVIDLYSHQSPAARRGSDHLPIVATVELATGAGATEHESLLLPP